jgi:exodeoxyribonuclease VII large subunit
LLYQEFVRLKNRLEAEGLFDPARKRPIPHWPRCIGVITSPTGAALRDMLNTLRRRYPLATVVLAPTPVQGDDAPPGIVAALERICRICQPDVILVARGGGSMEDLWAFNDERVARAIAASASPVISGVGHETDFTIADFVADLRAPTPTAAAEMATPNLADLREGLDELQLRLVQVMEAVLSSPRWSLNDLRRRLEMQSPQVQLRSDRQRLDSLTQRGAAVVASSLRLRRAELSGLEQRLAALSPQSVLNRGYALLQDGAGHVIHHTGQVQPGQPLTARLSDGELGVRVENITGGDPQKREATSD